MMEGTIAVGAMDAFKQLWAIWVYADALTLK